jgi:hypothetical protein
VGLSWWGAAGLVALGAAGVVGYGYLTTSTKLAAGELVPLSYEVVATTPSAAGKRGSRVTIAFVDPRDGASRQQSLPLGLDSDQADAAYPPGEVRAGWYHTGLAEPYLHPERPDPAAEARVERAVAAALGAIGVGLLAFAWGTGRLLT